MPFASNVGAGSSHSATWLEGLVALANAVGPGWTFAMVLAFMILCPKIGLAPHCVKLWVKDRADNRQKDIEMARLLQAGQSGAVRSENATSGSGQDV